MANDCQAVTKDDKLRHLRKSERRHSRPEADANL